MTRWHALAFSILFLVGLAGMVGCGGPSLGAAGGNQSSSGKSPLTLLNVSYDPTREFYQEFNAAFAEHWQQTQGQEVTIEQSHGGSGKQARAVMDGLEADIVTLALAYDIDVIAEKSGLLRPDWRSQLPHASCPYTSTIVFLVRKGNPHGIKDWSDLVRGKVSVITPNPKTSGGARWIYLAAWGAVLKRELGDLQRVGASGKDVASAQAKAREFVTELFRRVPVLDSGARGATNTFLQRGLGDVLLTWENEAFLALRDSGAQDVEIVVPPVSILAEPPVAVVEQVAAKHGTTAAARAYLEYLYSATGQRLAAKHYYRPADPSQVSAADQNRFARLELFRLEDFAGNWHQAQAEHFADGGTFDQIYQPGRK